MRGIVAEGRPAGIDYLSVVDPDTLQPVAQIEGPVLVALAVRIGATRLIDNLTVDPRGPAPVGALPCCQLCSKSPESGWRFPATVRR